MHTASQRNGQSLVEFALLLPILLVILIGVFDFGRAIYAYNAVSNAAREGGRTAIVNQTPEAIRARAAQQATALGIPDDPTGCPVDGRATTAPAGVCMSLRAATPSTLTAPCPSPAVLGCVARVSVKWTFTAITPLIGNIIGPIPISATTEQSIESVCSGSSCPTQ